MIFRPGLLAIEGVKFLVHIIIIIISLGKTKHSYKDQLKKQLALAVIQHQT
jgi:hypothetical protein